MTKLFISLALMMTLSIPINAQKVEDNTAEADIMAPIYQLFEGMSAHDTAMMQSALTMDARLETVVSHEGQVHIHESPIDVFLDGITKASDRALYEHLWPAAVSSDGALATVWTPYTFYVDGVLSHCGANAFQLIQTDGHWKIRHIIDTRRKANCKEVPPALLRHE